MVDGALPEALSADDRLRELVESGIDTLAEVALVRVAVAVVNRAAVVDPQLGPQALGLALASEGIERGDAAGSFAELLSDVAQAPPQLVPFTELLEDLDRRRMGRRGMEERMRSVFGITRVLSSTRETGELMRLALEEVRRIVGAASASVERWDRDINALRCLVNVGALGPGEETFPADEVYPLAEYAQARRTMLLGLPTSTASTTPPPTTTRWRCSSGSGSTPPRPFPSTSTAACGGSSGSPPTTGSRTSRRATPRPSWRWRR
jgi:hypothetical protein